MIREILFASVITLNGVVSLDGKSPDYKAGFCDGFNEAVEASWRNRDHFMKLDPDFPFETLEESHKRIFGSDWNTLHKEGNSTHKVVAIERDAVDMYVVLASKISCQSN